MKLNERQLNILEDLYYSPLPIDSNQMMLKYEVSLRTIRYDISKIRKYLKNEFNTQMQNKKNKGYYIKPKDKTNIINLFEENEDITTKRIEELVLVMCMSNENLSIEDISEKMYFSASTIRNLIKKLNESHVLEVYIDEDKKVKFNNTEKEIRTISTEYLVKKILRNNQDCNNEQVLEILSEYFDKSLIEKIIKELKRLNKKYNIWISNYAYVSELVYFAISHVRYSKKKTDVNEKYSKELLNKEYQYSKEIVKQIIDIEADDKEILLFMNFIISKGVFIDPKEITDSDFIKSIDRMMEYFSKSEINKLDLDTLRKDISRHLGQFLKRNITGFIEDENPILQEIKNNYPKYYQLAAEGYKIFMEDMNLSYSESEISYIAIYLYKNKKEKKNKKYRVVTVCGTGRGLARLLQTRLENVFGNIEIIKNLSSHYFISNKDIEDIDFIISTVNLPLTNKDVIVVSAFLGRNDIRKIRDYMDYGNIAQSIPVNSSEEKNIQISNDYKSITKLYSDVFLKLYDSILDMPEEYSVNEEKMLGLTIHLILAIPRILEQEPDDFEFVEEMKKIENQHSKVSNILDEFFKYLENKFNTKLNIQEKYAFYQYII